MEHGEHVLIRPANLIINKLCYASLIKHYEFKANQNENDSQPEKLIDENVEPSHFLVTSNPKILNYQRK